MTALPGRILTGSGPQVTRVSCPDCSGVLTIEAEGRRAHLTFTCRVGHRFAVPDLLIAKEERLEERLWAALHGVEELAELLKDLLTYVERQGLQTTQPSLEERATRARVIGGLLRRIIEDNRAIELNDDIARIHGDEAR